MKNTRQAVKPCVCELTQLELPLEPPKTYGSPATIQTSTADDRHGRTGTQVEVNYDDRIGMTAFSFSVTLQLFACALLDRNAEKPFASHDDAQDFASHYAADIFRANLSRAKKQEQKRRSKK